ARISGAFLSPGTPKTGETPLDTSDSSKPPLGRSSDLHIPPDSHPPRYRALTSITPGAETSPPGILDVKHSGSRAYGGDNRRVYAPVVPRTSVSHTASFDG